MKCSERKLSLGDEVWIFGDGPYARRGKITAFIAGFDNAFFVLEEGATKPITAIDAYLYKFPEDGADLFNSMDDDIEAIRRQQADLEQYLW
jgi:hypothetical protein